MVINSLSSNSNAKWYFYQPKITPTVGSAKIDLTLLLTHLISFKNFDNSLKVPRNNDNTLLIYEIKKNTLENYISFHFFKVKGKIDDLIADLNTGTFSKVSDEIIINPTRGLLKQSTCCYDITNNVLAWQSCNSPTTDDLKFYFENIFHHNIRFLPVKDPKSDEYFRGCLNSP